MNHPSLDVNAALLTLNDALCSWERSTGQESVLILRGAGGYVYRTVSGKPGVPDDVVDQQLFALIKD